MKRGIGWLIVLVVVALLVAACGPSMATPTPGEKASEESPSATAAPVEETSTPQVKPSVESSTEYPVDADDWHILGSPDAPVTIVEYADFQ